MRQPLSISAEELQNVAEKQAAKKGGSAAPQGAPSQPSSGALTKALSSGGGSAKSAGLPNSAANMKWQGPTLEYGFNLDNATEKAFQSVQYYMNDMLGRDDMELKLEVAETGDVKGHVSDKTDGRVINTYQGTDMLKIYAQRYKERGIIVDGRI